MGVGVYVGGEGSERPRPRALLILSFATETARLWCGGGAPAAVMPPRCLLLSQEVGLRGLGFRV